VSVQLTRDLSAEGGKRIAHSIRAGIRQRVFRSHVKVGDGDSILIWRAIDRLFVWWQAAEIIGSAAAATGGRGVTGARFRRVLRPTAGEAKTMSPSGAVRNQKGRVVPAPVGRSGLWGSESTRTLGYVPFGV